MARDGGLRPLFHTRLPSAHWQGVETWSTGQGVPDTNYCFPEGREGWIEFKVTATLRVTIRPEQVAWAERRCRVGGKVFLAVRLKVLPGPRKIARDAIYLYGSTSIRQVHEKGLSVLPSLLCEGGPARWNWTAIAEILRGGC